MGITPSRKIDVYCHILPPAYMEVLNRKARPCFYMGASNSRPALHDMDVRFRVMDKFPGFQQVVSIGVPPLEYVVDPADAVEMSIIANDGMADLVAKHPDRFVGAVACLPMNSIDDALREMERAIEKLNFKGVQIYSSVNGKPLDSPEFMPLYQKMSEYDLPIWLHPARDNTTPDYPGENASKYGLFIAFGWPYETTLAMARLVFSGVMEKFPNLKIIAHHCGGMIPFFEQRIMAVKASGVGEAPLTELTRPPLDYFRGFYGDTVLNGSTPALMCGHAFFGGEHMLFASDYPYPGGAERGEAKLGEVIAAVEAMQISDSDKARIFGGNAEKLLHL